MQKKRGMKLTKRRAKRNRYLYLILKRKSEWNNKFFDKIKTRVNLLTWVNFFRKGFSEMCVIDFTGYRKNLKNFGRDSTKKEFTGNFLNKFYKNLKNVTLFLHFLYLVKTLSFFNFLLNFYRFLHPKIRKY